MMVPFDINLSFGLVGMMVPFDINLSCKLVGMMVPLGNINCILIWFINLFLNKKLMYNKNNQKKV